MSEGQVFFSVVPNITMHLPGVNPVEFKNGRFPKRKDTVCTDPQVIAAIKGCPEYMKTIISEEDRIIRDTPDPKVTEDLISLAMERLSEIPGVTPSELIPSNPQEEVQAKSPVPSLGQLALDTSLTDLRDSIAVEVPSLTRVSRMKKDDLMAVSDSLDLDLNEGETVAILRRQVRSYIKQLP